ncbi:hypothetical protein [Mesorhizobium sp. WSM4887]|uniref:hypothetical protein n=1 Tax=Mesorhizobium sp. WSM4887 TaxID=3038543 RepID=UPI00241767C7|nr:hypothetical protein [Mesorhizobium sp. WSM4887]MDG4889288.1 hypothetical protein [Mesorhizobium sp. WSM4887]
MKVTAHFEKSTLFRTVHADGCQGSITPRGDIHCSFYSERFPLPVQSSFQPVSVVEAWCENIDAEEGAGGVQRIREYEVGLVVGLRSAVPIYLWFEARIEELRKLQGISDEDWQKTIAAAREAQGKEAVPAVQTLAQLVAAKFAPA